MFFSGKDTVELEGLRTQYDSVFIDVLRRILFLLIGDTIETMISEGYTAGLERWSLHSFCDFKGRMDYLPFLYLIPLSLIYSILCLLLGVVSILSCEFV